MAGPVHGDTGLSRLDSAIGAFGTARAQVLRETGNVIAAAIAVDAADDACAAGATNAATAARATVRTATPRARLALSVLPARNATYSHALDSLAAAERAATSLNADQRAKVDAVVAGGRDEKAAADAFRVAGSSALPAYAQLDATQSTWLDHRIAGWFRTQQEAADAYVVMRQEGLPALQRARTRLERVDATRRLVSERERAAVAAADTALASLRRPG